MGQYDGAVLINTKIDTKSAIVRLAELQNRMSKTADKIASLRSKMDSLKDAKIPTQEYSEISAQIEKAEQKFNKLLEKQEQMQREGKNSGAQWQRLQDEIEQVGNTIKYAQGELQDLVDTGKAFTLGSNTEEFANLSRQLHYATSEFSILNQKHDVLQAKQQRNTDAYKKLGDIARKALNSVGNTLKKLNSLVDSFTKRIKSSFSKLGKSAKEANKGFAGISLSLKNILKYGFGIRSLYVLVNKLRSGLKEGFENLLTYSKSLENSINGIKATSLTLKNAFAAAFSPFVEIALPYVQKLLDYMVQLVNVAGQFFAALTGRKTYTKAIKQSAKASEAAAEATEDETKAMNKQLSSLDKLNNLTSDNNEKSKDAVSGADAGIGQMFEEVPIESGILDAAEKIKDILSKLFEPLKKAWEQEGQFAMDSWKYALEEVWKLIKDIGRDFLKVWNEDETVAVLANILHIIGDIGLIVGNLARNFREAWNTNQVGLEILRNIRDVIGIIVQHIRNMADATVEWADKLNFYPILDAFERFLDSIKPVVDAIWGIIEDFYVKVILPLSKWAVEKGLPDLLQVFIDFNKKVDWESLRKNLAEFWEHLEPFAETVGEGLILFIRKVSEALADFLNSQEFKDFLKTVEDWMDSVSPEDVADALTKIGWSLIFLKGALLGYSAIKGITGILTTIKAFLAFFGVGGGAATAAGGAGMLSIALHGLVFALAAVTAAVAGWKIGEWINEKLLGVDTPSFTEMMEGIKSSFTDGSWKEALKLWGDDIYNAFVTLGERQDEAIQGMKEKIAEFGEYIKEDWNNAYIGQMIESFKDGSWKEALNLWGEDIKAGIKSVGEFIKEDWNNSYIGQMINSFTDGSWKEALSLWKKDVLDAFDTLGERMTEKWDDACESLKSTAKKAFDWISQKWSSISSSMGTFGSKISGSFKNFSISSTGVQIPVSSVVAALSNVEIPAYATGQVIPRTMKQHLAILGDNSQETEVVSPLSTMKQAVIEALSESGFSGMGGDIILNITAELDGEIVFNKMQKLDRQFYKQNGRHAFT